MRKTLLTFALWTAFAAAAQPPEQPPTLVTTAHGQPGAEVFRRLQTIIEQAPKADEFSSSADRAARDAAIASKAGELGAMAVNVMCLPTYDGDARRWNLRVIMVTLREPREAREKLQPGAFFMEAASSRQDLSTEVVNMQNAYGATTEVTRVRRLQAGILMPQEAVGPSGAKLTVPNVGRRDMRDLAVAEVQMQVPMPPDEARAAKGRIGCSVLLEPQPPFAMRWVRRFSPTRDMPTETTTAVEAIVGRPIEWRAFHVDTGQLLATVK